MKKIAYLQLHRICDQKCIFCAQPSNGSVLDFQNIKSQLDIYKNEGYSKVIFSGGEPSLNKDFFQVLEYCRSLSLEMTILSNGHRFAEYEFAKLAIEKGLVNYHISLHSHIERIHDELVKKPGSLRRCFTALTHLSSLGANITVNITINSYNVRYFDRMILAIIELFPKIDGFIINNLETSQIPENYYSVIAQLSDITHTIPRSLEIIQSANKKVRIERVPLCYIRGYEHFSTDLEYTVQGEQKYLHFLGETRASGALNKSNYVDQSKYGKQCEQCDLYDICAGMEGLKTHYSAEDLIPQKLTSGEKEDILLKFKNYAEKYINT